MNIHDRTIIESSVLCAATYHPDASLKIEFTSGAAYRYFAVPAQLVRDLLAATSKGAFFNARIRPRFHYERIDA